jgi:K+ transporter
VYLEPFKVSLNSRGHAWSDDLHGIGLEVVKPDISQGAIIGITSGILVLLFAIQPLGVARIGGVFAPIIIVWLLLNASFGIYVRPH